MSVREVGVPPRCGGGASVRRRWLALVVVAAIAAGGALALRGGGRQAGQGAAGPRRAPPDPAVVRLGRSLQRLRLAWVATREQPPASEPDRAPPSPSWQDALAALEDGFADQPRDARSEREGRALGAALAAALAGRAAVTECACGTTYCRAVVAAANDAEQLAAVALVADSLLDRTVAYSYAPLRTTLYLARPGDGFPVVAREAR